MRAHRRCLIVLFVFAALLLGSRTSEVLAQTGKLLPVDEAVRDPELFVFRARLQAAVARHDTAALLEVVDPNIKIGFGGNDGIAAFRETWKLQDGDRSPLWAELGLVLALGGQFQGANLFAAPYVFTSDKADAYEEGAVLGANVRVRAEPRLGSQVLATLSFDIVRFSNAGRSKLTAEQAKEWTAVELQGKRTGYIASQYVRSPVDYRALFNKIGGRWRMTAFVAGD